MEKLARLVRWFFGLQALLALLIPLEAYLAVRIWLKFRTHADPRAKFALVALGYCAAMSIVCGFAWWALKKGWPSARVWSLAASAVVLPFAGLHTLAGLAGLIVFARRDSVRALTDAAKAAGAGPRHSPGDGTHKYIEWIAPVLVFVIWVFARSQWAVWGHRHGLPSSGLPRFVMVMLAIHLAVVLHEAGHLLAGWGSEMVLRAFQVGPLSGRIRAGRWKFGFSAEGLIGGGSVSMVPKDLKHIRGRLLLMIVSGPVASLLTGSIATLLALSAPGKPWEFAWGFLALLGTIGFCDFLFNLTPLQPEGAYSDGAQIFQLMSAGPWAIKHLASAMVGSSLATPLRPRDFDLAILERAASQTPNGLDGLHYRMYLAMHHLDCGRNDEGIAAWRQAVEQDPAASEKLSADTTAELAFYEGAVGDDVERAKSWWQKVEAKGNSRKEVDYWKGRTAVLLAEGNSAEAAKAFRQADEFAQKLPEAGAYDYDRWCVDVLRRKLNATDLARLNRSVSETIVQTHVPAIS